MMQQLLIPILLILGLAGPGFAQTTLVKSLHKDMAKTFGAVAANPSDAEKKGLFNELLGANSSGLAWPDFPRTWIQKDIQNYVDTNTSYVGGLNLPASSPITAGISHKYNIAYRYSTRISFVAVAKLLAKDSDSGTSPRRISDSPLEGKDLEAIRVFDPKTNKNYFRVDNQNPMVGFCVYEMSLNITKSHDNTISFNVGPFGGAEASGNGEIQSESQAVYSKFFQIDGDTAEMDYLKNKCQANFQAMVRPYVENDFNKILLEYYTYNHPQNQCVIGGNSSEDGDENCLPWFRQTQNPLEQKISVPRCEQASDGISRCVLKSRAGSNCPLYVNPEKNAAVKYIGTGAGLSQEATINTYAHTCDQGLHCQMEKKPWSAGSLIMWPGFATCH